MKPQNLFYPVLLCLLPLFFISCEREHILIPDGTHEETLYSQQVKNGGPRFQGPAAAAQPNLNGSLVKQHKSIGSGKFQLERTFHQDDLAVAKVSLDVNHQSRKAQSTREHVLGGKSQVRLASFQYEADLTLTFNPGDNLIRGHLNMIQDETKHRVSLQLIQRKKVYLDKSLGESGEMVLELEGTPIHEPSASEDGPTMILYFTKGNLFFDGRERSFATSLKIRKNSWTLD